MSTSYRFHSWGSNTASRCFAFLQFTILSQFWKYYLNGQNVPLFQCCRTFLDNQEEVREMNWVLLSGKSWVTIPLHYATQCPLCPSAYRLRQPSAVYRLKVMLKNQTMISATFVTCHMDLWAWFWESSKFRKCCCYYSNYVARTFYLHGLFVTLCRTGGFILKIRNEILLETEKQWQ